MYKNCCKKPKTMKKIIFVTCYYWRYHNGSYFDAGYTFGTHCKYSKVQGMKWNGHIC